jgi:hypothetical protein
MDGLDFVTGEPADHRSTVSQEYNPMWHQLHMARYYVHKMRMNQYRHGMAMGLSGAEANELYTLAMDNYDELMMTAGGGAHTDANQLDMDKGFTYEDG